VIAFILRRLAQSVVVLLVVGLISFAMFRFVGDPVNQMVGVDTPIAQREQIRRELGLDKPVVLQFAAYLGRALHGDFGISYQFRQPVAQLIGERMPATLELAAAASALALLLGIPLGVLTALGRGSWPASAVMALSLVGVSLPTFLTAILLRYVFSVSLGWLPSYGRGDVVSLGLWTTGFLTGSGLKALVLPAVTLALFQLTLIMRLVRAEMLEVLRTDYIRFARARGLPDRTVHFGHALKNTLVPVITVVGLQIGSIIAFALITEYVFQWPGMGLLFLGAVQNVDVPIMAAYLMLVAALFVAINLVVDVLYAVVDPRLSVHMKPA
jgi:peptide/nickel transport system permease protein